MARWIARSWALVIGMAVAASAQAANDWTSFAQISTTIGASQNYLCKAGTNADIGCPTTAPYVDASRRVGLGTSSPQYKLVVSNNGAEGIEFAPALA